MNSANTLQAVRQLEQLNIDWLEQPVKADDIDAMVAIKAKTTIPLMIDEGLRGVRDMREIIAKNAADKVNIKLMKCGGVAEARKMITLARELGMQVMIGCMTETRAGISAATTLSPLVDYADLDGHVLLGNDPYDGIQIVDGKLTLVDKPGTGVTPL